MASDLISRTELIDKFEDRMQDDKFMCPVMKVLDVLEIVEEAPTVEPMKWIPCSEGLPEERDSVFKKFKGTNKWRDAMFESISDEVNITVELSDGTRKTKTSYTIDGKWKYEKELGIEMRVIAWMPLPEPYKDGEEI